MTRLKETHYLYTQLQHVKFAVSLLPCGPEHSFVDRPINIHRSPSSVLRRTPRYNSGGSTGLFVESGIVLGGVFCSGCMDFTEYVL